MHQPPQKRFSHASCIVGNKMYVFGGLNAPNKGGNLQTFYSCQLNFNMSSPSILYRWEKIKGDAPRARDSLTLVNVSLWSQANLFLQIYDNLILFGGCGSGKDKSFNDIHKFDIRKKQWSKLEAFGQTPAPREAHIAQVICDDKMVIHGGINQDQESFSDTWVLGTFNSKLDRL